VVIDLTRVNVTGWEPGAPSTPGSVTISVSCGEGTETININVLAAGPATNGGTNGGGTTGAGGLPATGSDGTNTTLMLGLGALIVGGGLFGVSQIRRRQTLSA
jgi:LPXTG-motif cell wall-anchored protein